MSDHHLTTDRSVAVSDVYYWQPMTTCPAATKVLLLGAGGVATIGQWNGRNLFWVGWAALPRVRKT